MPKGVYARKRTPEEIAARAAVSRNGKTYKNIIGFCRHDNDSYRVWRDSWKHDVYELFSAEEFTALQDVCYRLRITLAELDE